jgi:type II restriction enzyme
MTLSKDESKKLQEIQQKSYMQPVLARLERFAEQHGLKCALDYLHEIIVTSKDDVEAIIQQRLQAGLIRNADQARKTIVGSIFPYCLTYVFLKLKQQGLVKANIYITSNKNTPVLEKMLTVYVDGETQKPDMDLIIYSLDLDSHLNKCMVLSLKTSLRERAGQTYRWKLLLEIATSADCSVKERYNISYDNVAMPIVCFVTINFYDEINNPQHRGMLKFFDNAFIGKPIDSEFISRLSTLVDYANEQLA